MQYFDGGGRSPLTAKCQVKCFFRLNIICSTLMGEGEALQQQSTKSISLLIKYNMQYFDGGGQSPPTAKYQVNFSFD